MRCDYQWLSGGRVLDQLKHAEQGYVVATELLAARRYAIVHGVTACVHFDGRGVRNGRYAIPGTRIRESHEQRKRPQPKNGGGEELAMAAQYARHDFFGATGSLRYRPDGANRRRSDTTSPCAPRFICPFAA